MQYIRSQDVTLRPTLDSIFSVLVYETTSTSRQATNPYDMVQHINSLIVHIMNRTSPNWITEHNYNIQDNQ